MTSDELQKRIKDAVAAVDKMSCNDALVAMNAGILDRRFKRDHHVYPCYNPMNLAVHTYDFANAEFKRTVNLGEITVEDYFKGK